jgi:hypothetical protein
MLLYGRGSPEKSTTTATAGRGFGHRGGDLLGVRTKRRRRRRRRLRSYPKRRGVLGWLGCDLELDYGLLLGSVAFQVSFSLLSFSVFLFFFLFYISYLNLI